MRYLHDIIMKCSALFSLDLYSYSKASRCTTLGTLLQLYLPPLSFPQLLCSLTRELHAARTYPRHGARLCHLPITTVFPLCIVRASLIGWCGSACASKTSFSYPLIRTTRVCYYASRQPPPRPPPPPSLPSPPPPPPPSHHYHTLPSPSHCCRRHHHHHHYQLLPYHHDQSATPYGHESGVTDAVLAAVHGAKLERH